LIFDRINLKKNTNYDFRDVKVKLYRNLPTDKYTEVDSALKLRGLLSDESVINMLPYELDAMSELNKIDEKITTIEEIPLKDRTEEVEEVKNKGAINDLIEKLSNE
jgi:hypothetical protein